MDLQIELAKQIIHIHARYDRIVHMCENYLSSEQCSPTVSINISEDDILEEFALMQASKERPGMHFSEISVETNAIYRKIVESLIPFSTFLMHGSVVSDGKYAYMFTAPSGTGKTARTYLFLKNVPNSFVINGDKPLLKIENNNVLACGTPWCGKEGMNTNTVQPLCAIFFLERADYTKITELSFSNAFPKILEQAHLPSDTFLRLETLKLIHQLYNKVRFYHYCSSLDDDSVLQAWHMARSNTNIISDNAT